MQVRSATLPGISRAVFQNFIKKQPVKKVFLFGSQARGEARSDSDIDLVVELDYSAIHTGLEFFALWDNLEQLTGKKIDLITMKGLSKRAIPSFEKDKILIYERPEA